MSTILAIFSKRIGRNILFNIGSTDGRSVRFPSVLVQIWKEMNLVSKIDAVTDSTIFKTG